MPAPCNAAIALDRSGGLTLPLLNVDATLLSVEAACAGTPGCEAICDNTAPTGASVPAGTGWPAGKLGSDCSAASALVICDGLSPGTPPKIDPELASALFTRVTRLSSGEGMLATDCSSLTTPTSADGEIVPSGSDGSAPSPLSAPVTAPPGTPFSGEGILPAADCTSPAAARSCDGEIGPDPLKIAAALFSELAAEAGTPP